MTALGEGRERQRSIANAVCLTSFSNAYVSFGGLLLELKGPVKKLTPLRVDNVYLLIKR